MIFSLINIRGPLAWGIIAAILGLSTSASGADLDAQRLGFSGIVYDGIWDKSDVRFVLSWLAEHRYNVVGLPGSETSGDEDVPPSLILSGTAIDFECLPESSKLSCRMSVLWEVEDAATRMPVYRVQSRHLERGLEGSEREIGRKLLVGLLYSVSTRPGFRALFEAPPETQPSYPRSEFADCQSAANPPQSGVGAMVDRTVIVQTDRGVGSGFWLNQEGLILTAAHVVAQAREIQVRSYSGASSKARVLRLRERSDVALLIVETAEAACLARSASLPTVGEEVYVIGAPAGNEFTLTRGIVSRLGTAHDGAAFIQTDAAISPGNSGGPLLNASGEVLGVVVGKRVGFGVENVGFAVSIESVLSALGLTIGPSTGSELREAAWVRPRTPKLVVDSPDPWVPLRPRRISPRFRARAPEVDPAKATRAAPTWSYVETLRLTGAGVGALGALVAGISFGLYAPDSSTRSAFETLQTFNDIGWVMGGLGAGLFMTSFILPRPAPKASTALIRIRGAKANLEWHF